jgi:hypothetical protein
MQRKQFFDYFELHDDAVFDNEVDSIGCVELDAVIDDRKPETGVVSAFETASSLVESFVTPSRMQPPVL